MNHDVFGHGATYPSPFGLLLRHYRVEAGLTQEELAERAQVSARAISDVERGVIRRPHPQTVRQLAQALDLTPEQDERFRSAARNRHETSDGMVQPGLTLGSEPAATNPDAFQARNIHVGGFGTDASSFIGRKHELSRVVGLIQRNDVRLLTLIGPGGIGKTRLALQVGRTLAGQFAHGAAFVSLASSQSPDHIPGAVAGVIGVTERAERTSLQELTAYLREKEMLLILDNFEHVSPAAPTIGALIVACPGLKIMVTSRSVLHLAAEHVVDVPPLMIPEPTLKVTSNEVRQYDAILLFAARARARNAAFEVNADNAEVIAEICRRVDGLPLAIELAAARIHIFPPRALLRRLSHRLQLLTGSARDVPARQQTLRNTVDWSYDLLTPDEQRLFARLSVFRGGCTLEAVESICGLEGEHTLDPLEGMTSLVEQSLVRRSEGANGEPRFGMLATIDEYAEDVLDKIGETKVLKQRHAEYFTHVAESIGDYFAQFRADPSPSTFALRAVQANQIAEEEQHNFAVALNWLITTRNGMLGLRLVGALWQSALQLGLGIDLRSALVALLPQLDSVSSTVRARAMLAAAILGVFRLHGQWSTGHEWDTADVQWQRYEATSDEAIVLFRQAGDTPALLSALVYMAGGHVYNWGNFERAEALFLEALHLARELDSSSALGASLRGLGEIAQTMHHDDKKARRLFEDSLAVERAAANTLGIAFSLHALAWRALLDRDAARAIDLTDRVVQTYRAAGSPRQVADAQVLQGIALLMAGEYSTLQTAIRQTLSDEHFRRFDGLVSNGLALLAASWAAQGRSQSAARVFAAATTVLPIHEGELRSFQWLLDECLGVARARVDRSAWQSAWEEGEAMTLRDAVLYAMNELARP